MVQFEPNYFAALWLLTIVILSYIPNRLISLYLDCKPLGMETVLDLVKKDLAMSHFVAVLASAPHYSAKALFNYVPRWIIHVTAYPTAIALYSYLVLLTSSAAVKVLSIKNILLHRISDQQIMNFIRGFCIAFSLTLMLMFHIFRVDLPFEVLLIKNYEKTHPNNLTTLNTVNVFIVFFVALANVCMLVVMKIESHKWEKSLPPSEHHDEGFTIGLILLMTLFMSVFIVLFAVSSDENQVNVACCFLAFQGALSPSAIIFAKPKLRQFVISRVHHMHQNMRETLRELLVKRRKSEEEEMA